MSEHVDAVVVGSGFGGSVSAYRLAEAGLRVIVLERGKAYPPGSFARTPHEMGRNFWDPSEGLHGLFDVWTFNGFDSIVSSGLGGGSLIYANVLLRKEERWFVQRESLPGGGYETWPVTRAELDPHYDAVEHMLGATRYPLHAPAYAGTPKTEAMRVAAKNLGLEWELPPLAVSFSPAPQEPPGLGLPIKDPEYGNLHGRPRRTCRLCGECDLGCNDGAKNTLDHTYLSAAKAAGADLRTRHEVRGLRARDGGGYEVTYVEHDPANEGRRTATGRLPLRSITCDLLILAAGTYGTTFLLLRNRAGLPGLNRPVLGRRFSGNGDLLTFLLPRRGGDRGLDASRGPVITSSMTVPDHLDRPDVLGRGFHVQDGGYAGFVDWLVENTDLTRSVFRTAEFLVRAALARLSGTPDTSLSAELARLLGDGTLSAGSLPLLGIGRDVPDGVMSLRGDRLTVDWTTATSKAYFARMRRTMRDIADVLDTRYVDNPLWFFRKVVTVHPLGGAPIGRTRSEGVCGPYGEAFDLPGLYVADGAAMPGPVGPNPSLTIAALADRMCTRLLESRRARPSRRRPRPALRPVPAPDDGPGDVQ
ncbi:GMC family oxidoreductase [Actinomadura sp. ATCC 31491]|uniref:Cholesterol oxidase n=1 Tax=Actinomadura luzonensis TaxID=2805427 RepID=A0ABT0G4X7_9ACTN|nr:GMC family oxidoreductase [Actinomadura luzonensis]MCK2219178.1 GMC family oxidoreductase [Actinomadura luzonensis]